MKYNIISINDERQIWKDHIRRVVGVCEEVKIPSVIGSNETLADELSTRGLTTYPGLSFSVGELGVWLSVYDCWQWCVDNNEELIIWEDDASPADDFDEKFKLLYEELPRAYEVLSIWPPTNQYQDYLYNVRFNEEGLPIRLGHDLLEQSSIFNFGAERLARAYQGYGNVATVVSPEGAGKMIEITQRDQIYSPVDCWIWQNCHKGLLNGYSPKPRYATLVYYHWPPTTVHNTQRYVS